MKNIKMGIIADDFTGAADAASFLVKGGNKVVLCNSIPEKITCDCDYIVIAEKIRSVDPEIALERIKKDLQFLSKLNVNRIYYKFCSTFDSTRKGNIGPVMDYLLDTFEQDFSILCPSLPINGRTVKDGILYVDNIPLSSSPLKDHPLNPMWDSNICNLMKPQSKYPCFVIKKEDVNGKTIGKIISQHLNNRFYIIPDYVNEEDGKQIARVFKDLKIMGGGSGLLEFIGDYCNSHERGITTVRVPKRSVILCGSCSLATKRQINYFRNKGGRLLPINGEKVFCGEVTIDKTVKTILKNLPESTLVYSDAIDKDFHDVKRETQFYLISKALEDFFALLGKRLVEYNFDGILVAGGETSGAVMLKLGYQSFYIEKSIAPGVPILIPEQDKNVSIILKSGNFGNDDFFTKALRW
ncbi:four-carbon acid sugar kinase family protein [Amedibacterium intestinale]|uniref:four-carbon acid sugar kinase family protein n=1 Tax=Amedibacterium intestinale TaxID=2583452 RepID=UPI000E4CB667|nr:four-carbon acid sugar kinase family protein [Amedibacterium intestinale]RHO19460.1 four-carbon acid sugar kinase family protein [Eubacterium sp. AM18-26]RHO22846.1 four-carbon acid sugar kinase family protein [Eubacterium sp. AM18-10LB-B]RHO27543.1 four-carbon acid sugar kinase family protein [Erysipelotrichaceae bacterium AM17-60]